MADNTVQHAHKAHDQEENAASWEGGVVPFKASYGKLMMWYFLVSDAFTFAGFLIAYGALRFSMPTWPEPDFVFTSFPFVSAHWPLIFVTFMTFVLIFSSVTMVRAVQEGHRENQRGVVYWMILTIFGGLIFLCSQAYEWTTLIAKENVSVTRNPFGRHVAGGVYLDEKGEPAKKADGSLMTFEKNDSYLLHYHHGSDKPSALRYYDEKLGKGTMVDHEGLKIKYTEDGFYKDKVVEAGEGPKAFGALFFFITGFHGFHVFSGVLFLTIIMINAASGVYANRRNGYEMVEKIGLYWHFVDLVWVFVFLVFYLL